MQNWASRNQDDLDYYASIIAQRQKPNEIQKQQIIQQSESQNSDSDDQQKRHDSESQSEKEDIEEIKQKKDNYYKNLMKNALGTSDHSDSDISVERDDEDPLESALRSHQQFKEDQLREQRKNANIDLLAEQFKNAETVYRDQEGKKVDVDELKKGTLEYKRQQLLKKNMEAINQWSKGLIQMRIAKQKKKQFEKMKNQSFHDNKDFDDEMKKKQKFNDPMQKIIQDGPLQDNYDDDEQNGFEQFLPKLRCRFAQFANRFNIEPGYRWDGADRSNEFEKKYIQSVNQKKIQSQIAYIESAKEL